jgi:hypothetical protein
VEDEKTPTTSEEEDVEAHLLRDRSGSERPDMDASSEGPEVEGHLLSGSERHLLSGSERPDTEANDEGPDVELHGLTERPGQE